MKRRQLRTWIFISAILFFLLLLLPLKNADNLYNSVIRIHVLANSDSDADQELKLKVRDAILEESGEFFTACSDRKEAIEKISSSLEKIQKIAETCIAENGYSYPVRIELGNEEYPTRNYESMSFPEGSYLSLRVLIGEGEGQNWWCVLFPPLCLDAATESAEDAFIAVGLNPEEYKIITDTDVPKYKVRFKILEALENIIK